MDDYTENNIKKFILDSEIKVLNLLRLRYNMYLGSKNLQFLWMMKMGWSIAASMHTPTKEEAKRIYDFPWTKFERYVEKLNTKKHPYPMHSFHLAQFIASGKPHKTWKADKNYKKAWDIWWGWYDDFVKENNLVQEENKTPYTEGCYYALYSLPIQTTNVGPELYPNLYSDNQHKDNEGATQSHSEKTDNVS